MKSNIILILALILVIATGSVAQDVTVSPVPTATQEVTQEVTLEVVLSEDGEVQEISLPVSDNDWLELGSILWGIVIGGGGVFVIMQRLNSDKVLQDRIERLVMKKLPPQVRLALLSAALGLKEAGNLGVTILDGKPNDVDDDKPKG